MEKKHISLVLTFISLFLLTSSTHSYLILDNFIECFSHDFPLSTTSLDVIHTPSNSSYSSLLESPIRNLRFLTSTTPKPLAVITPSTYDHVQATVTCCRKHGVQIRTRSGGHDYEGLSYTSNVPFIILDLVNLRAIDVNSEENSAWVQSGASLGELYYWISQKSPSHGFPAGICPTIGVGGHFSGGGYGTISRKYGLAADNVLDALIVNADGQILDRKSMGEDLFWAIRGGGGSSFGVIVAWKIKISYVPPLVTVFSPARTLDQGATNLVYKWQQIANKLPEDLFIRLVIVADGEGKNRTIRVTFNSLFLGRTDQLLEVMKESFPELGLIKEDCREMSWIETILYFDNRNGQTIDGLKNRVPDPKGFFKATSDYVEEPLSQAALEKLWKWSLEEERPALIFEPYGGIMDKIPEWQLPFPHRKGNLYNIQYFVQWSVGSNEASERHINWMRRLYQHMTPYVSKGPRRAYLNYRDLDFGVHSNISGTTYSEAKKWGAKYFSKNYRALAFIKGKVDPENFFNDEQSIPPFK
ncbi:O-acetylstemmadenine oxidase-like [Coffea arabica]|uniref:O-acetylstemmadenine oxidase-like n=1 Tax=Coffea arabica TaxID=13443 RepID=A0A6P6U6X1_COFAR|nr:berberine bridge enzyme-like 26 [Coffea arabica]